MRKLILILAASLTLPALTPRMPAQQPAPPTPAELQASAQPSADTTWWKHAVVY